MATRHIGVIKNTGSSVFVVYRKLPDNDGKCLILYRDSLPDVFAHRIISTVEGKGQRSVDLFEVMNEERLEGRHMLTALHNHGLLKAVDTSAVVMHVGGNQTIRLDELNNIIDSEMKIQGDNVKKYNPFDMGSAEAKDALEDRGLVHRLTEQAKFHHEEAIKLFDRIAQIDESLVPNEFKTAKSTSTTSVELPEGISQTKAIELVKKALKERENKDE